MAKRRDLYERLARLRAKRVPIRQPQHVRAFQASLEFGHEIKDNKGKVLRVTGLLRTQTRMAGLVDPIDVVTIVDCDGKWSATDELEKGVNRAQIESARKTSEIYKERLAAKHKAEAAPEEEEVKNAS